MENNDIQLKQSWWHIEDEIEPSDGRLVYRVQDFYIKEDYFNNNNSLDIPLGEYFVGFKVRNKNSGHELSFIADYTNNDTGADIKVNLGSSSDWPKVKPNVNDSYFLHIKIQYEYIDFWPIFEKRGTWPLGTKIPVEGNDKQFELKWPKSKKSLFQLLFLPGYNGQFDMLGDSQGEFSVTVPLGMHIKDKGNSVKIILFNGPIQRGTPQTLMGHRKPHITYYDNKLKYHYIINKKSYNYVLKTIKSNPESNIYFHIRYDVRNDRKFYSIPGFAFLLFVVICVVDWNFSNLFYFVLLLLSLSTLHLTLRKEKYQIPFHNAVFYSIPLLALLLGVKLYYNQIMPILYAIIITVF